MKYSTAGAFRQALEERLRQQALETGIAMFRLRKMVAFDRLLARLAAQDRTFWILKGGILLQWLVGWRARATKDIDAEASRTVPVPVLHDLLRQAGSRDLADWFQFQVGRSLPAATGAPLGGARFPVLCRLDGRQFERFHLDVGQGDVLVQPPREISGPSLLDFADIPPARVLCYPPEAQIAEKLHAYTRPYRSGESSRVRDLADILLLAAFARMDGRQLHRAIQATFAAIKSHEVPRQLPAPPAAWRAPYGRIARELMLDWKTLEEAADAASRFLNPILPAERTAARWQPAKWQWSK
ncbi:MAG: nucleotidyl transferase AbiEii/AbiGii toxin family protein [Acidobacteria bacterium]|nr:nucleotidyl transferase AbiEii/AbiGii toxin family protein [Acidobacteriota bacterium]